MPVADKFMTGSRFVALRETSGCGSRLYDRLRRRNFRTIVAPCVLLLQADACLSLVKSEMDPATRREGNFSTSRAAVTESTMDTTPLLPMLVVLG